MTQHIGTQGALFGICPCRLVVGDALGWHQQGGDGIDKRGLARTNIAGEQSIAAFQIQRPDALVEGAPIEDFELQQAKAGERLAFRCALVKVMERR